MRRPKTNFVKWSMKKFDDLERSHRALYNALVHVYNHGGLGTHIDPYSKKLIRVNDVVYKALKRGEKFYEAK